MVTGRRRINLYRRRFLGSAMGGLIIPTLIQSIWSSVVLNLLVTVTIFSITATPFLCVLPSPRRRGCIFFFVLIPIIPFVVTLTPTFPSSFLLCVFFCMPHGFPTSGACVAF